ncbi:hypothetical protein O6H91_04G076700 [Diphasiastrum complanatum]|uniref:Uncharacterized protein n=2 Tax=Diphasiastrum complanatum TaxID=34168 RepID=A0ACC2DYH9_DIPCM|nr:hypothetical protein O6H91_04G076700 [Diphasiastrum complanatum]KAJ7559269.1 hypothetical protein O6H91_04G076700 [Diphasiastrum complanatum]
MRTYTFMYLAGLTIILLRNIAKAQVAQHSTPALFVFGDSLVDPGNNNYIPSLSRANILPNGIDFPAGPTGRFCNGRTVVDAVCELSGFPFLPAYFDPSTKGTNILKGVNYASGAGGILDRSGANYVARISLSRQIDYFQNTITSLQQQLGDDGAATFVSKSLYAIIIGNNDYINNYLLPFNNQTRAEFSPQAYQELLLSSFSRQLQRLYNLGVRKFALSNIGPLGCIPSQISVHNSDGTCVEFINAYIRNYNAGLKSLVNQLNSDFPDAKFIYANAYDNVMNVVNDPAAQGFKVVNRGCCGAGRFNGQVPCIPIPSVTYCSDRNDYLFWDPYHPTDAFNVMLAQKFFSGGQDDVNPINLQQLLQL